MKERLEDDTGKAWDDHHCACYPGESAQDLVYSRRRYIHPDALRNAIAEVVNAIFRVRAPSIWGEGTTACASDAKHFGAWDQNLLSEWATGSPVHARLGIYKDQQGVPGDLVIDAGAVDVTTIAAVEATISKTLFGKYWLTVIFESASSLQITLQSSASTNVGDYGAEGPVGGANVLRPSVTYGPLPSTYPSVTTASFETANIPRIWLRSGV